jgi:nucleoside-diphosphate-sugar epimerase
LQIAALSWIKAKNLMKVVITGGAGFLGRMLAESLLKRGRLVDRQGSLSDIDELVLFDQDVVGQHPDRRVRVVTGSICDPESVASVITDQIDGVFHLAAVVSGEAEANFEKGMAVNLGGTLNLLEACRRLPFAPRLVFASSVAAFGGELPSPILDNTATTPRSSYGVQKVVGELLLNEYSRKNFVDGRGLRLPTICVRPGPPNKAASGFASGIIREPIDGITALCPVTPETLIWLMSPPTAVANLVYAHELPQAAFGHQRCLSLEGLTVSVDEMVAALRRTCGNEAAARVEWHRDPAVEAVVATWPGRFESARARELGFYTDLDFETIIRTYLKTKPK